MISIMGVSLRLSLVVQPSRRLLKAVKSRASDNFF
jgi:hypothetical protein